MTAPSQNVFEHDSKAARIISELCQEGYEPPGPELSRSFPSRETWRRLRALGTELWLDTGDMDAIAELWTQEMSALTTNNTLLNKEVQKGIYDDLVPRAASVVREAAPGISESLLVREIAFVLNAVHGLRLVQRFGADVSVELHTAVARDAEASYHYGRRFAAISPEHFIVKVPLTPHGLLACRRLRRDGVRVNFTLGFSARENYLIARVARPCWVNVFMGRCNAFVAQAGIGDGRGVGEKATLASQRMLRELGVDVRQIGASMRDARQVYDLMGLDVLTMPVPVAHEYLEMDPPPEEIHDRTGSDPEISLAPGHTVEGERLDCFWVVDETLRQATDQLLREDLDAMTGEALQILLRDWAVTDLMPELDAAERERLAAGGKIPDYAAFRDAVQEQRTAWDSLLTEAGLLSFAADQAKLDERVRRLIAS